jgi:ribonuclease BN (tRNA processing enzyme)
VTLAYRLDAPAGSIVFGADTSPTPRLTELARAANVLVHMCHFLNRPGIDPRITRSCSGHLDAATTARDAGVGTLVLVHITPEVESREGRERVLAEAAEIFSGRIVFGEDLSTIDLAGNVAHAASDRTTQRYS